MDKVQIYYMALLALGFVITTLKAVNKPEDLSSLFDNREMFYGLPIKYALALPIAGRIFGWW